MTGIGIVAIALLMFLVFLIFRSIHTVPQGAEYTVERLGKYVATLSPGFHIINPLLCRIGRKVSKMEQILEVSSQDIISRDKGMVRVDGVVFFEIKDSAIAAYKVSDLNRAISNMAITNIRNIIGSMDLNDVISERDDLNNRLLAGVDAAASLWGVKINRVDMKRIEPPEEYLQSMARLIEAEKNKHALILEAEGLQKAAILKAEAEKQAAIIQAEADKASAFRNAEARERLAQAEARAAIMTTQALSKSDTKTINYLLAKRYTDALKNIALSDNSKVVLMPLESSTLIGSVEGMRELSEAIYNNDSNS